MTPKDKINKAAWNSFQAAKDEAVRTLTEAIVSKQLKVESSSVDSLLSLMTAAFDAGYQKSSRSFDREINSVLSESSVTQAPEPKTKKK